MWSLISTRENIQEFRKKEYKMKKIIVPLITGVVALAVGAALLIGKIKGKKKTTGNMNEEA